MKTSKQATFTFLVLVSLTLIWCWWWENISSTTTPPTSEWDLVQELSTSQTITATQIIYAAKKGDSVEAHPAWLTVSVTLDWEIITELDIIQKNSSPKSAKHQAQFAQQIEGKVVWKKLSESNAIYISSASTTSRAFNDAIKEIQTIVDQWQS